MKIKEEHFIDMEVRITEFINKNFKMIQAHKKLSLGKDKDKRFRWDIFWASKYHKKAREYYSYLNDDHLDTALKKIMSKIDL